MYRTGTQLVNFAWKAICCFGVVIRDYVAECAKGFKGILVPGFLFRMEIYISLHSMFW